jgi:hypothetical protein
MIYISKARFEETADGSNCRGFDFAITVDGVAFKVRNYLDRPGEFTVGDPETRRKSPQVLQLVDYLVSVLGGEKMFFYDARGKIYRELDLESLEFKADENTANRSHPDTMLISKLIAAA